MKKLTAHIFVALLGVTSVGIAHADIASTTYVDNQKTAIETNVNTLLGAKADKAETLAGYGIADAMTTTEVTNALGTKANTSELGTLAGKNTIGTAEITDGSVTKPKLATDVQTSLGKADTALQTENLTDYAKIAALDLKADKTAIADMQTKTAADAAYAVKGTETVASGAATAAATAQGDVNALTATVNNATTGLVATKKIADDAATAAAAADVKAAGAVTAAGAADAKAVTAQGAVNTLTATVNNATTGLVATKKIADDAASAAAANATAIGLKVDKTAADAAYAVKGTEIVASGAATAAAAADAKAVAAASAAAAADAKAAANTTAIATKADKATTLAGYGIADAMTTTQVTNALGTKANTADLGALARAQVPSTCGDAGKHCVLTYNGTTYGWEVVVK